jgi:hypothetical protein
VSERIAIRLLANLNIIARIDIPARDDAVDLRRDVAVAEVEFGLSETSLGGFELGRSLLDGGGVRRKLGEYAVDVALIFRTPPASSSGSGCRTG